MLHKFNILFIYEYTQGLQPQTVKSSVLFLSVILHTHNYTFIALTETWLGNHLEAELNIDGYKILRKDRDRLKSKYGRLSGGVAIYIKEDLARPPGRGSGHRRDKKHLTWSARDAALANGTEMSTLGCISANA